MRRVVVVIALVVAGCIWPAASAFAGGSAAAQAPVGRLQADFDNDGADDLAVGIPGKDVGSISLAGAVNVLYGSASGVTGAGSQLLPWSPATWRTVISSATRWRSGTSTTTALPDLAAEAFGEDVGASRMPVRSVC